jgi:hypothetical protein
MTKGAVLSDCRRYRYRLWRCWGDGNHRVAFVGINPSTADEVDDDATIRKCVGFAKRWGFSALDMVNLFIIAGAPATSMRTALASAAIKTPHSGLSVSLAAGNDGPLETLRRLATA